MKRLIKLQLRNIFHNKVFYVCTGISLLLTVVFVFVGSLISKDSSTTTVLQGAIGTINSGVDTLGMIFITIFCTFDFSEGTAKNIIARGYTKVQFLFSKYIASLIGILAMDLILIIVQFILYFKNGLGYEASMPLQLFVGMFRIVAYTVLYGTVAFILEKTSSAVIANLFAPNVLSLALITADTNLKVNMSKYWIDSVATKFVDKPIMANAGFPLVMYIIYIVLFVLIGIYFARGKDIK